MRDRLPAYGMANRVKITQDDGTIVEGVLSYADGATQQGSAYNKANVLPDIVCMTLGLSTESEPRDLFDVLAHAGDLHVWRKTVKNAADVPAGYNLGVKTTKTILNTTGDSGGVSTIYYSSSVSVSDSGEVSLKNPASTGVNIYTSSLPIVGKFFYIDLSSVQTSDLIKKKIYFVPSDTVISVDDSPKAFSGVVQEVTGYAKVPAGTTTTYPVSTNPNAYQEGDDAKEAGYVVGDVVTGENILSPKSTGSSWSWNYSDSVSVDENGVMSLVNQNSLTLKSGMSASSADVLIGKYVKQPDAGLFGDGYLLSGGVFYIPNNAVVTQKYGGGNSYTYFTIDRYQPVTGYPAIPAGTTIEYLGKLGNKTRVITGSYIGTGVCGAENPTKIKTGFPPKLVAVNGVGYSNIMSTILLFQDMAYALSEDGPNIAFEFAGITWLSDGVRWYSNEVLMQGNKKGATYRYIVIG